MVAKIFTLFGVPEFDVLKQWQALPYYSDIVTEDLKDYVRRKNGLTFDQ
ncbi:MAG: hypothetical protein ACMG6E_08865 [Candidatus Roizmanbacteria bacterium]